MESDESASPILLRKLPAVVELPVDNGGVSSERDVRRDGFRNQVVALALVAGIGVGAEISVGPAVESALLDVGEVVGYQIVSQFVALLNGGPKLARLRMEVNG